MSVENKDLDNKPQESEKEETKKYDDTVPGVEHFQEDLTPPSSSWSDLLGVGDVLKQTGVRRSTPKHRSLPNK